MVFIIKMENTWKRNSLSWSQRFEGYFKYNLANGEEIAIKQSPENEPPQCVYDAAIILAEYIRLTHLPKILESKKPYNILEVGSGCGFSSIYLKKHSDENVNFAGAAPRRDGPTPLRICQGTLPAQAVP